MDLQIEWLSILARISKNPYKGFHPKQKNLDSGKL